MQLRPVTYTEVGANRLAAVTGRRNDRQLPSMPAFPPRISPEGASTSFCALRCEPSNNHTCRTWLRPGVHREISNCLSCHTSAFSVRQTRIHFDLMTYSNERSPCSRQRIRSLLPRRTVIDSQYTRRPADSNDWLSSSQRWETTSNLDRKSMGARGGHYECAEHVISRVTLLPAGVYVARSPKKIGAEHQPITHFSSISIEDGA